jgi:hypothetical protein
MNLTDSIKIVDLPGIYAMDTYSNEEKVSRSYDSQDNDKLLNYCVLFVKFYYKILYIPFLYLF